MFPIGLARILILAVLLVGGRSAIAEEGQIPSVSDLLKRHHIQLTQPALVEALKSDDQQVRYLASQKLADDKATNAIPAIMQALASEKVPWTRMNIAFALAEMGEEAGFASLESDCGNRDSGAGIRTQSAGYMLMLDRDSPICRDALLDVLQTGSSGYRAQAASLLVDYRHHLSAKDLERVFGGLVKALQGDGFVQMAAARALADLGDARAIPELRDAVEREREEAVRLQMQQDLKILQEKVRQ